jgi:hypothetical protein
MRVLSPFLKETHAKKSRRFYVIIFTVGVGCD